MRRPLLATISMHENGGGVAVVARLLWQAFERKWPGEAAHLSLIEHSHTTPTVPDKVRFTLRLGRTPADWILFSHLGLARAQLRLPSALQRPYGIFLHGVEAWCPLSPDTRALLARADLRLANSTYTAERVMAAHPDIGPVTACPLALPQGVAAASSSTSPAKDDRIVLMVGRMASTERYKGHDEMIESWPRVVSAVPRARLVIVGDGDDVARLQAKAADAGLESSVQITGFVDRPTLHWWYRRASVFALPSRGEGFGLVYLEAMAHRLPCVGSIHDAARDVIDDGRTGTLVDQHDRAALADSLIDLLQNDAERARMGAAGYLRLMQQFSFTQFESRLGATLDGCPPIPSQHPVAVASR